MRCGQSKVAEGEFPLSAIDSDAGTKTRAFDDIRYDNRNEDLAVGAEGTIGFQYTPLADDSENTSVMYLFTIGDSSDYVRMTIDTSGNLAFTVRSGNVQQCNIFDDLAHVRGTTYTIFGAWKANDFELYVDGSSFGTPDTSGSVPADLKQPLFIGQHSSPATNWAANGNLKHLKIWIVTGKR